MRAGGFLSAGSAVTSKHIKDKTTGGCVAELSAWRARAALPVPEPDGAQQLSTRREKLALPTQWTAKIIEKKKKKNLFLSCGNSAAVPVQRDLSKGALCSNSRAEITARCRCELN